MNRTGLVVEGGGMKCAYSAGILDRFLDNNISFDYCIGVSAGSANTASYLAGQRDRNRRFYTEHIKDPKYLSIRNFIFTGQMFGLQYIYGDMTNSTGVDPIDYPAIMQNPTEFEIVATDGATGKPVYFSKDDMKQDDYRAIMASCALPVFCKPIAFKGMQLFDGGVADSIPFARAQEKGCDRIVVILSKPRNFVKQPESGRPVYSHVLGKKYPALVSAIDYRHIMYRNSMEGLKKGEDAGQIYVFAPTNPPKMSTFSKNPALEQELYDLGVADFDASFHALQAFLQT